MSDVDVRAAIRVLERYCWRGLDSVQFFSLLSALEAERARRMVRDGPAVVTYTVRHRVLDGVSCDMGSSMQIQAGET